MSLGDLAALLWIGAWFAVLWRLRYYDGMLDQLLQELQEELIGKKQQGGKHYEKLHWNQADSGQAHDQR